MSLVIGFVKGGSFCWHLGHSGTCGSASDCEAGVLGNGVVPVGWGWVRVGAWVDLTAVVVTVAVVTVVVVTVAVVRVAVVRVAELQEVIVAQSLVAQVDAGETGHMCMHT